jgi:hypothetical protein
VKGKVAGAKERLTGKKPATPADQQPVPGRASPRPTVTLPFSMAREAHKVTLTPQAGSVAVTMSSTTLPFTTKLQNAHLAIENFREYMTTIEDPEIRARYEREILPAIVGFSAPTVEEFTTIYNEYFPKDQPGARLAPSDQPSAKAKMQPLVDGGERLLRRIQDWAAATGIEDLTRENFEKAVAERGRAVWSARFIEIQAGINEVISGFNYKGVPLQYTGSARKGWRGPHKAQTRFDATSFDVDLYVVHPADFTSISKARPGAVLAGKIFPRNATPELRTLSDAVAAALAARYPDVRRIRDSVVVLRGSPA